MVLVGNKIWLLETYKLFITVFMTIHWAEHAQPARPKLLNSTLLIGLLQATPEEPNNIKIISEILWSVLRLIK